jgi:Uma2 family endonuclease
VFSPDGIYMSTVEEIKHALRRISADERNVIAAWLRERIGAESESFSIAEPAPAYAETLPLYMTLEQYLEFEEKSPLRHEYVNGVVQAMSTPSLAHAIIADELSFVFKAHLRGSPCRVFASIHQLRINSATDDIVYRPDVTVACNSEEWGKNYVCNPKLVAEVLSPSTERIDRREKALTYRAVNSIEEYVLIEQDKHKVIIHRRAENWVPHIYEGAESVAEFRSISLVVPLTQIYAGTLSPN